MNVDQWKPKQKEWLLFIMEWTKQREVNKRETCWTDYFKKKKKNPVSWIYSNEINLISGLQAFHMGCITETNSFNQHGFGLQTSRSTSILPAGSSSNGSHGQQPSSSRATFTQLPGLCYSRFIVLGQWGLHVLAEKEMFGSARNEC